MSGEKHRGILSSLRDKFTDFSIGRKTKQDTPDSAESLKTAADYIHENEMRLRTYSAPTRNTLVRPRRARKPLEEEETDKYVFEKVKPKSKLVCLSYDMYGLNINDDQITNIASRSNENILHQEPIVMRPRTLSMPTENPYQAAGKRVLEQLRADKHEDAERNPQRKGTIPKTNSACADTSYDMKDKLYDWDLNYSNSKLRKLENVTLNNIFEDEIRTRTSSMPTRSTYTRPNVHHLRRSHQDLFTRPEIEIQAVRAFEISTKGKLIKRSESRSTRSSSSIHSVDDDIPHLNLSRDSSIQSADEHGVIVSGIRMTKVFPVLVIGNVGVGKTALVQQFLSTQYLGGFDTSIGKICKQLPVILDA